MIEAMFVFLDDTDDFEFEALHLHAEDFMTTVDFLNFIVLLGIVVDLLVFLVFGEWVRWKRGCTIHFTRRSYEFRVFVIA